MSQDDVASLVQTMTRKYAEIITIIFSNDEVIGEMEEALERVNQTLDRIDALLGEHRFYMDEVNEVSDEIQEAPDEILRKFREDLRNHILDLGYIKKKAAEIDEKFKKLSQRNREISRETKEVRARTLESMMRARDFLKEHDQVFELLEKVRDGSTLDPKEVDRLRAIEPGMDPILQDLRSSNEGLRKLRNSYQELGDNLYELLLEIEAFNSTLEGVVRRFTLSNLVSGKRRPEVIVKGDRILVVMEVRGVKEEDVSVSVEGITLVIRVKDREMMVNLPERARLTSVKVVNDTLTVDLRREGGR
ncbi:Chromosome partition protein Smc [Metallosphaera sp. J1]|uniref:Hsp20/alpha crystallin family protein n=1 Tax=Metallosphaera javensis (ex Hofmann et al. 2022) TaxID=99938 RepID=UPI001EDF1ABE|nr:Hsp20/alpha crystallin family protein [Metallosphaera javensis (ex Hofmann et al. 2022)]MCG3109497.1 Chromosome partition protein Smc [Metallosphaera javensis (ex Hofmann et al. 2022)]